MSRGLFEGLPIPPREEAYTRDYIPSGVNLAHTMEDEIAERITLDFITTWDRHYRIGKLWDRREPQHSTLQEHYLKEMSNLLDEQQNLDHNRLLEQVVLRLVIEGTDCHQRYAGALLTPLVQGLYDIGHNNFYMDLLLSTIPKELGTGLCGRHRRPLRMRCKGNVHRFAEKARDVDLILDGDTRFGGHRSRDSMFTFLRSVDLSNSPRHSTFHLDSIDQVATDHSLKMWRSHKKKIKETCETMPAHCRFYIQNKPDDSILEELAEVGFFEHTFPFRKRNRLYVPQGKGGWKEVTP